MVTLWSVCWVALAVVFVACLGLAIWESTSAAVDPGPGDGPGDEVASTPQPGADT